MFINKIIFRCNKAFIIKNSALFDKSWYSNEYNIPIENAANHYLEIGYKIGCEPSQYFSGVDYHLANPDTKIMNPLLHYEVWGKDENRILSLPKTIIVDDVSYNYKISKPIYAYINNNKNVKTCAIFASYSVDETISDYVVYLLSELKKEVDSIIFIADNNLKNKRELDKIKQFVDYACFEKYGAYDFGSYKRGIEYLKNENLLNQISELYLINDSCYGPINGFKEVFNAMRKKKCDFWGLLDSNDTKYHLLSFFYCFKNKVINDPMFYNFFKAINPPIDFSYAVMYLERELTCYLKSKYACECYLPNYVEKMNFQSISGNNNATLWPLSLLENGFPLVKIKALDGRFGKDLHNNVRDVLNFIKKKNINLHDIIIEDIKIRTKDDKFLSSPFDMIAKKKIVSFDIFDTLLIRPFDEPTMLFDYIEKKYKEKGFLKLRIDAERRARLKSKNSEVTFKEIYEIMPPKYTKYMSIEMYEESRLLYPNLEIMELYNYAIKNNKKIVAISDMYFDSSFLKKLLFKNGFKNISEIYVSSEHKKNKGSGDLFAEFLKNQKCNTEDICHIGDNINSDINAANKLDIETYKIEKSISLFLTLPAKAKYACFYNEMKNIESGAYIFLLAYRNNLFKKTGINIYNDFGYSIGGPIVLSYLTYICKEAKSNGIDKLLFVARDGFNLKKAYNEFFKEKYQFEAEYTFLTRATCLGATLDYFDTDRYLLSILKLANKDNRSIKFHDNYELNKKEFERHKKWLLKWSKINEINLTKHLNKIVKNSKNIALVDVVSSAFTSLNCANKILKDKVKVGFCMASFFNNVALPTSTFYNFSLNPSDEEKIILLEKILSSPENAIIKVNSKNQAVYDGISSEERNEIYNEIYEGISEYIKNYRDFFKDDVFQMSFKTWLCLADNFIKYKNVIDDEMLSKISYSQSVID